MISNTSLATPYMDILSTGNIYPLRSVVVITLPRMNARSVRAYIRIVDYSRVGKLAASARQESGLRMHSLSTPRRVYPAKRARLLDAKAIKGKV